MKYIKVELTGSAIGCTERQRATIVGLGLHKQHSVSTLEDTPSVRGMVTRIAHLVHVTENANPAERSGTRVRRGKNKPQVAKAGSLKDALARARSGQKKE